MTSFKTAALHLKCLQLFNTFSLPHQFRYISNIFDAFKIHLHTSRVLSRPGQLEGVG